MKLSLIDATRHSPSSGAIGAEIADPRRAKAARRRVRHRRSGEGDISGCDRAQSGGAGDKLILTVAGNPRHADDLPGKNFDINRTQPLDAARIAGDQPLSREQRGRTEARARFDPRRLHRLADHPLRDLRFGRLRGRRRRDDPTRAHDGDGVGDAHDFVELVADEDDRVAFALQPPHQGDEFRHLCGRKNRGRLIEDQNVRAAI